MSDLPAAGTYNIDASHTHVGFAVKHFGLSKVRGEFQQVEGAINITDPAEGSNVSVTIPANSFNSRDEGRDAHIRSADFLDVEQYPTLTFVSTGLRQDGEEWIVTGDLTIHGVTRSVELQTEFGVHRGHRLVGRCADECGPGLAAHRSAQRLIERGQ